MKRILSFLMALMICLGVFTLVGGVNTVKAADDDIASGTCGECSWVIDASGMITIRPTDGESGQLANLDFWASSPWYAYRTSITKAVFEPGVKANQKFCYLFDGSNVVSIEGLGNVDTSETTDMSNMCYGCQKLETIDLTGFDTSHVTNMANMFGGASNTAAKNLLSLDLSGFDTSNVTNMSWMFSGLSKVPVLDVSGFDTSNVTNMSWMFQGCSSLTSLDVSNFDTSNVMSMSEMFVGCSKLTSLDVTGFNTENVRGFSSMFDGCEMLSDIDVSGFKSTVVTDVSSMFRN